MVGWRAEATQKALLILTAALIIARMEAYIYIHIRIYFPYFFHVYISMATRCLSVRSLGALQVARVPRIICLCLLCMVTRQSHVMDMSSIKPALLQRECGCHSLPSSSCPWSAGQLGCCGVTIRMCTSDSSAYIFNTLIEHSVGLGFPWGFYITNPVAIL